jgi:FKBP-type peptidyl-prolyl cis-trans isomerase 2
MALAKDGDMVRVHYTGTLNDGTVFDSSREREPLEFTLGCGQVIPGFDKGIVGMEISQTKSINIPAGEAYGERNDQLIINISRDELPPEIQPEIGMQLEMMHPSGQKIIVSISNFTDEYISLDGNHPLAGNDLNFDVELVSIVAK